MTAIFDLDGTLLDTIGDLGRACNYALEVHHYPTHPVADYRHMVGNGMNRLICRALPENHRFEHTVLQLRESFVEYYNQHLWEQTHPYEGIASMLLQLKKEHVHLAVASNKYQAAAERIVRYFFPDMFEVIEGEREGRERKPNPQIVYDIKQQINDEGPVWYIGDSPVDVETAQRAQVNMLACSWGFASRSELLATAVSTIVDNPQEICSIICKY